MTIVRIMTMAMRMVTNEIRNDRDVGNDKGDNSDRMVTMTGMIMFNGKDDGIDSSNVKDDENDEDNENENNIVYDTDGDNDTRNDEDDEDDTSNDI